MISCIVVSGFRKKQMKGARLKELNILYPVMTICTVYIDFLNVFWSGEGYPKGLKKPAAIQN